MLGSGTPKTVAVIGGGMAGSEAAQIIARLGHEVDLFEMKPQKFSPAHSLTGMAELVCSNSLGGDEQDSAPGLLKEEMRGLGSIILSAAVTARVPAGKALAVDREILSRTVTEELEATPNLRVRREECTQLPDHDLVIVATGPLTSDPLAETLGKVIGTDTMYFYDSISPIVSAETIDLTKTYYASRYQVDREDYLNCPMDRVIYEKFVEAIRGAEKTPVRSFEAMRCFEACLPIEVLAERGQDTLAFGPMKPVGLEDPRTGKRPHAVVQLRRENQPTTLYNLVGFQTRMKWGEQKRVFRMIPGLENAEFVRYGSMHRNTYLESPRLLRPDLALKAAPHIFVAGQLTGVEGYVESAAMGQWAGLCAVGRLRGLDRVPQPPRATAIGSLLHTITTPPLHGQFAPMNINFGLLPPAEDLKGAKEARRRRILERARRQGEAWRSELTELFGGDTGFAIHLPEEPRIQHAEPVVY